MAASKPTTLARFQTFISCTNMFWSTELQKSISLQRRTFGLNAINGNSAGMQMTLPFCLYVIVCDFYGFIRLQFINYFVKPISIRTQSLSSYCHCPVYTWDT
ncbi:hypothetical protein M514_01077 [Trichuris suis]|uniref:Uncharacterized protein n=1 Tax=Trichuris suis TaxID=68888 RepID=A0A085MXE1_9BILA|nr:hypothetical protein M513_01077 [Trichuris suis]KFD61887.1 hypothetical protein M514_01077 [Trichuris suis]